MGKKCKKKQKVEIVFDEKKRHDFLTGFRKRKNERRKKAKEQVEIMIKEEKKKIKLELKAGMKNYKKSYQPLQELTEEDKKEEYEDDEVEVKIVELSANDFAAKGNMIGANTGEESEEEDDEQSEAESVVDENVVPGMDLVQKKKKRKVFPGKAAASGKHDNTVEFKSKKDIDKVMKKKTLRNLKKTSAFKAKEKFVQVANRKQARREKNNTIKSLPKHKQKEKKKFNNDMNRKIKKGRGRLKRN